MSPPIISDAKIELGIKNSLSSYCGSRYVDAIVRILPGDSSVSFSLIYLPSSLLDVIETLELLECLIKLISLSSSSCYLI